MSSIVNVSGISSQTSEKDIRDFFSFCGKISDLKIEDSQSESTKSATVTFEKETAAKTALLLDSTQLGPAQIHVTSSSSGSSAPNLGGGSEEHQDDISQEDKPRSRIVAEYLAHGYVIGDQAIQRAIALDQQHGVSQRFLNVLNNFDSKYKVTDKAQAADQKFQVTNKAYGAWGGLTSYFEKAANTPTGQKLRAFYEQGNKQVMDVHNEARHLANLKGNKTGGDNGLHAVEGDSSRTKCNCGADTGKCPCAPGTCACSNCAKNPDEKTSKVGAEEANMEKVEGGRTKCNCGSDTGKCPCAPGTCACSNCAKNPDQ